MIIKNLSQLKKALKPGAVFRILRHRREEYIGQTRMVNIANTQGIYSIIPDDPTSIVTTANCGKGYWLAWRKAVFWSFDGNEATLYSSDTDHSEKNIIIKFVVEG